MKVTGPGGMTPASGPRPARSSGGQGAFQVAGGASSAPAAPAAAVSRASRASGVVGVEALLALQDVESPTERRRRSVRRATRLLDELDDIKISLLGGDLDKAQLERLGRALREQRAATEDPKLEAVLDEIETRAAVEMAKLEIASRAA